MKSLAERKAEKAKRDAIKARKRSNHAKTYTRFRIPTYRLQLGYTTGDEAFLKKKAVSLLDTLKNVASHQFWRFFRDMVVEEERVRVAEREVANAAWNNTVLVANTPTTVPTTPPVAEVAVEAAEALAEIQRDHIIPIEADSLDEGSSHWSDNLWNQPWEQYSSSFNRSPRRRGRRSRQRTRQRRTV